MKRRWLVYLITAIAACAAGVAIAGVPQGSSGDDVLLIGVSTSTTAVTATTEPSTETTQPATTQPVRTTTSAAIPTVPSTSVASTTTSEPVATTAGAASSTLPATSVATTAVPTTIESSTTSPPGPTTGSTVAPRGDLQVAVANGAGVTGLASSAAVVLREAGFGDVVAVNTGPVDESTVFAQAGLEDIADAIVIELGLSDGAVAGIEDAPAVDRPGDYDIVVVLGTDRVP